MIKILLFIILIVMTGPVNLFSEEESFYDFWNSIAETQKDFFCYGCIDGFYTGYAFFSVVHDSFYETIKETIINSAEQKLFLEIFDLEKEGMLDMFLKNDREISFVHLRGIIDLMMTIPKHIDYFKSVSYIDSEYAVFHIIINIINNDIY